MTYQHIMYIKEGGRLIPTIKIALTNKVFCNIGEHGDVKTDTVSPPHFQEDTQPRSLKGKLLSAEDKSTERSSVISFLMLPW